MTTAEIVQAFEDLLPARKCDLHITHNQHLAYYQSAEDYILNKDGCGTDHHWKDEDSKHRAIVTGQVWEMQWYPNTPISSYVIAAPMLMELIELARDTK